MPTVPEQDGHERVIPINPIPADIPKEKAQRLDTYMKDRASKVWKHFGREWLGNTFDNIPMIKELGPSHDLLEIGRRLPEPRGENVFVFSSGASLMKYANYLPLLKQYGYVLASPTNLQYLRYCGLEPDILFSSDSNSNSQSDPVINSGGPKDMLLVCPPHTSPNLTKLFPRKNVFFYNSVIQGEDGTVDSVDYSKIMIWLMQSVIKSFVVQAGCVTNQMVMIADMLRHAQVMPSVRNVLVGADYGYWNRLHRCPAPVLSGKEWLYSTPGPLPMVDSTVEWEGLMSDRRMVLYKRSLLLYWVATKSPIYDMSHGIFHEFPHVEPEDVAQGHWPELPTDDDINQRAVSFLFDVFPRKFSDLFEAQRDDTPVIQHIARDLEGKIKDEKEE